MKRLILSAVLLATAAGGQEPPSVDGAVLLKVRGSGRQPLYTSDGEGCPALRKRCQEKAYLLGGDLVVADGTPSGSFQTVAYTDVRGRATLSLLPSTAVVPITDDGPVDWTGTWRHDDATITVQPGASGRLRIRGDALWGASDPERVRNGAIHTGEFQGVIDGRRRSDDVVDAGCRVRLRRIGPYLIAFDNMGCGGVNVTFSGLYRRVRPPRS